MGAFLSESLTLSGKGDKLTPTIAILSNRRTGQDSLQYSRPVTPYQSPDRGAFLIPFLIKVAATGFGSGYAPIAPGTAGSLVGIVIYLALTRLPWPFQLATILLLTLFAVYVSGEAEKIFNKKDSSYIVIDEIVGQQFALFFVPPTILYIALGFLLFRLFDIVKPPPAGFCQSHLPGGWGVVMDDVFAGIWTNIILLLAIRFLGI
jgi:phosphatidylglycerophosphatase A